MADAGMPNDEQTLEQGGLVGHLRKTQLCSFFSEGRCKYGGDCSFAHTEFELRPAPDFRYMHMCKAFLGGRCKRKHCRFAHGVQEMRQGAVSEPKDPPARTKLSSRSKPFTPTCLEPVKLPPGLSHPDTAHSPPPSAPPPPLSSVKQMPSVQHMLQTYFDQPDATWSTGEDTSASSRLCADSAGSASDADVGDSQSSWEEALRSGLPMHL